MGEEYPRDLGQPGPPPLRGYEIARWKREQVDAWALSRMAEVAASTFNKELWVLKNIGKVAEQRHYLARSPASHLKRLREPHGRVRYLTSEERDTLTAGRKVTVAAKDGRTWTTWAGPTPALDLYIQVALKTGARRSE